jgi:hypothetical protein
MLNKFEQRRKTLSSIESLIKEYRDLKIISRSEYFRLTKLNISVIPKEIFFTEEQINSLDQIRLLHFENKNIFENKLISREEYITNNLKLHQRIVQKLECIVMDKEEKKIRSKKLDETSVINLRSQIQNLNNNN